MDNLNIALNFYKSVTEEILETVTTEEYDKLESLFKKRSEILNQLKSINYCEEDLKTIINQLKISELEEQIRQAINQKKNIMIHKFNDIKINNKIAVNYTKNAKHDQFSIMNKKA